MKKFRKSISLLLVLVMAVVMLTACGQKTETDANSDVADTPSEETELNIYLITKCTDSPYWQTVYAGARDAERELSVENERGVKITFQGPPTEADIDKQVQLVENAISAKADGIVLAACDVDALIKPVQKAKEAGIPVVMIDSGINSDDYDAFFATNNKEAASKVADALGEITGGKGKVAIVSFAAGTQTAIERESGFTDRLKEKYPDMEIVGTQYCDSDKTKGINITQDFITANPDLTAVYGANEQSLVGAATAVKEKGLQDKITVVGFDSSDDVNALLNEKVIKATAVQMPYNMGNMGVRQVVDILNGQKPAEKTIDTGVTVVTLDNIDSPESQKALYPLGK